MRFALTLIVVLQIAACDRAATPQDYNAAIQSGKTHQIVSEIDQLFPNAHHGISYFTGDEGKPQWTSKVPLYGRYVFIYTVEIELSRDRRTIEDFGPPSFRLIEMTSVTQHPGAMTTIETNGLQTAFTRDTWRKIVESNGDFIEAGFDELIADQPVDGFTKAWQDF